MNKKALIILSAVALMAIGRADAYDDKSTVSQFDFEEVPTDHGWRTYDLDGKSTYYFGSPRGWYMSFDGDNGICAATSLFSYDVDYENFVTPQTVPANDWLFSPAVEIPAHGSYELRWDARSGGQVDLEDFEVRVIDFDLLNQLEESFTSKMTLKEVSDKMFENSESLGTYLQISRQWTTYAIDINRYRGRKVAFIWRYCSNHTQLISIDNFRVVEQADRSFAVALAARPALGYTYARVPAFMVGDELSALKFDVINVDSKDFDNVSARVEIADAENTFYSRTFETGALKAGATASLSDEIDGETLRTLVSQPYTVTVTSTSDGAFTDVMTFAKDEAAELSENELAWDTEFGEYKSIGTADADRQFGQRFFIWCDAVANAITFEVAPECTVRNTRVYLYEDGADNVVKVGESDVVTLDPANRNVYTVELAEPVKLEAGRTYIAAVAETGDGLLSLRVNNNNNGRIAVSYTTRENHWVEEGNAVTYALALNLSEYVPAGIGAVAESGDEPNVIAENGVVTISGHGIYEVYELSGRLVARGNVDGAVTLGTVPVRGVYIVKVNSKSCKIVL